MSPSGKPTNAGTPSSPLDLATGLTSGVAPGSTVWLRGGSYVGSFYSYLNGTSAAPITVRAYPGERPIITDRRNTGDGSTLHIRGSWTIYRDFEVTNVGTTRVSSALPPTFERPLGIEVDGPNNKLINLVIHDTGSAIGAWTKAVNLEIYGNVIYNCGWNVSGERGHGHGIYVQNDTGRKLIRDNVVFDQYGWGIHAYPGEGGIRSLTFDGNIIFNNGINSSPTVRYNQILVAGYAPFAASGIVASNNYIYDSSDQAYVGESSATLCFGCFEDLNNQDLVFTNNYVAGGLPTGVIAGWQVLKMTGNTFVNNQGYFIVRVPTDVEGANYVSLNNAYLGANGSANTDATFSLLGYSITFDQWKTGTGLDLTSVYTPGRPTAMKVVVRPNAYQGGRANIAIYNWPLATSVNVDLSSVLHVGKQFEIRNVQTYFDAPIVSGIYDGSPVRMPLTSVLPTAPVGGTRVASTTPEFGAFIVIEK